MTEGIAADTAAANRPAAADPSFTRLKEILAQVSDLRSAASVLSWDQETYMPPGAAEARSNHLATLRRISHERFTSDEVGRLLEELAPAAAELDPGSVEASLVRVVGRDYEKAVKLPTDLVVAFAQGVSRAKEAWKTARTDDRFTLFAPHLEHLIDLNRRKVDHLGYEDRRYDALLDEYEPGMTTAELERIFRDLRAKLVPIVEAIADSTGGAESGIAGSRIAGSGNPEAVDAILHRRYDHQKQWDFGLGVIRDFGYDFNRGRQDLSAHPFTTTFSISDVRITTRVNETNLSPSLFGTLHEAGHALYEQGVAPELERTLLADGTSLGMHESQSRLWENLVGRSRAFWQHYYPRLQSVFPDELAATKLDDFYRAINTVRPGPIRVEADEVTYNLHVMVRFELELELLDGTLKVDDLPQAWNDRMTDYLGVTPDTDADGVLQDIHWSLGAFGYFPTYALGNLMSVQIYDAAARELDDLEAQIAEGNFADLLAWMREHVHRFGRTREAGDLLEAATGRPLEPGPWLAYVRRKYGELYDGLS